MVLPSMYEKKGLTMEYDMQKVGDWFVIIAFVLVVLVVSIVYYRCSYENPHWETITVTDKSVYPGQDAKWLIYTEDEVYSVKDLWLCSFFESSDVYNSLKIGKTYHVYVSGRRYPLISAYKVIRKVESYEY